MFRSVSGGTSGVRDARSSELDPSLRKRKQKHRLPSETCGKKKTLDATCEVGSDAERMLQVVSTITSACIFARLHLDLVPRHRTQRSPLPQPCSLLSISVWLKVRPWPLQLFWTVKEECVRARHLLPGVASCVGLRHLLLCEARHHLAENTTMTEKKVRTLLTQLIAIRQCKKIDGPNQLCRGQQQLQKNHDFWVAGRTLGSRPLFFLSTTTPTSKLTFSWRRAEQTPCSRTL